MKVTVIPSDNTIIVDGDSRKPTGAVYPVGVHAIQWAGEVGQIEHLVGPQETFTEVAVVQPFIDLHTEQKALDDTPAVVTFAQAKAAEFTKFRADRELFLNRLAGIGVAAQFNSQAAVVASVVSVRQALLDLTSDPYVVAATDLAGLKAAMKARYTTIVSGADPALYSAFRQVDS